MTGKLSHVCRIRAGPLLSAFSPRLNKQQERKIVHRRRVQPSKQSHLASPLKGHRQTLPRCFNLPSMRTRRGCYPSSCDGITFSIRPKQQKRRRQTETCPGEHANYRGAGGCGFDALHDDLLIFVLVAVSSAATSPADLVNIMLVNKRFCAVGTHPQVLVRVRGSALTVKAATWSEGARRFLIQCAEAGNIEACYILGMISFYCLHDRRGGAALISKAASSSYAPALLSLAVIRFNGSEGTRRDKDLKAGAELCARAASLGHVDAMREFGHCLQDGYGVRKNIAEGRRFLLEANAREAAAAVAANPRTFVETALHFARNGGNGGIHILQDRPGGPGGLHILQDRHPVANEDSPAERPVGAPSNEELAYKFFQGGGYSLLSDYGCNVPPAKLHTLNKFLVDWFAMHPSLAGLRLCSHLNCGRPELRRHEFRRCSACGCVNYCSRACQALDWKLQHKYKCTPGEAWEDLEDNDGDDDNPLAVENQDDT